MTNAEEKLIKIMIPLFKAIIKDAFKCEPKEASEELAKAIIKEFPQIEANKLSNVVTECLLGETVEIEIFMMVKK